MKKIIINNFWWVILFFTLFLLISHLLSLDKINVDYTTILLLVILIISPFCNNLKKIKFGELEAEINTKEVKKLQVKSKKSNKEIDYILSPHLGQQIESIYNEFNTDHILALAKLRIELEKRIKKIYETNFNKRFQKANMTLHKMIYEINKEEIWNKNIAIVLEDVLSFCNRAVHGEEIKREDAGSIIDIGRWILINMDEIIVDSVIEPINTKIISSQELDKYSKSKYKVVTVIPYVKNPQINIRILSQENLDAFLEGYLEYAEFIIEISKID